MCQNYTETGHTLLPASLLSSHLPPAPDCGLKPVDIVFINDASYSVGSVNFKKTLVFIENVVKALVIGPVDAQIGSVTFSTQVHLEFHLNTYSNKQVTSIILMNLSIKSTYTSRTFEILNLKVQSISI